MGEEKSLKSVKRKLKTIITELTAVSTFSTRFDVSTDDIYEVRVRLESLLDTVDRFELLQTELEDLEDHVPDEQRIAERVAFKDLFFSVKSSLMKLVDTNQENRLSSPSFSELTKYNGENVMRLPPINTPKFDGDWQMWTSFIDSFNAMFHNNKTLAPVQRLHYLKSCLEGQASEVIRSIPTTGENYLQAYNTLVNRYENKGAIIQSHIRSLLETPKVYTASATDLQRLHHHVMSNINALKALEQPVHSWDAWLVTLICSRMDSGTVGEWQLHYNSKELASFAAIESFLFNRIAAYEAGDMNNCKIASKPGPVKPPRVNEKKIFFTKYSENKAVYYL